jgi:multidrug efflux pump subunit AcrB
MERLVGSLLALFARNRVAANAIVIAICVWGFLTLGSIQREVFPQADLEQVVVTVAYPGATPREVEDGIVLRIEDAIADLPGVGEITSTADEGLATITAEVADGFAARDVLAEVKNRVDGLSSLPEDAERPIVEQPAMRRDAMVLQVVGSSTPAELRRIAEDLRNRLIDSGEISQVELQGVRDPEFQVLIDEQRLRSLGLSREQVALAIRRGSLDVPGGSIRRPGGEVSLRATGQARSPEELARLPLLTTPAGTLLRLGDVARVEAAWSDRISRATYDGQPAIGLRIFLVGRQDLLRANDAIRHIVDTAPAHLPPSVQLVISDDRTRMFHDRVDLLTRNGISGLILVFVSLALFLHLRLAIWVTVGIPVAMLGALAVMPLAGVSINMLSLFGFILVLGILVDDGIVVAESIHSEHEQSNLGPSGAIIGVQKVAIPVVMAVLTTVVTFAPMLFLSGVSGKFFYVIPVVVIGCLLFSLVESLLVLPAHLSERQPAGHRPLGVLALLDLARHICTRGLFWVVRRIYAPSLTLLLRFRYATLAGFLILLSAGFGLSVGGHLPFIGFPRVAADFVRVSIEMPVGTHHERTWAIIDSVGRGAQALRQGSAAAQIGALTQVQTDSIRGSLVLELKAGNELDSGALARAWRAAVGELPGVRSITYSAEFRQGGPPVNVELSAHDPLLLAAAAAEARERIGNYSGAFNLADTLSTGKDELVLQAKPAALAAGLRLEDLGRTVRNAFTGAEAERIQLGRDEVRVLVRLDETARSRLSSLDELRVRLADGGEMSLGDAVDWQVGRGPARITRIDRRRTATITADVDEAVTNPDIVLDSIRSELLPQLRQRYPGVSAHLGGGSHDMSVTMAELKHGMAMALLVMYVLMAITFSSYLQPVLIMTSIPFGIVGAFSGHLLLGLDLSIMSLFGIVALTGVVVNDAIVLVDAVNVLRAQGLRGITLLVEAGSSRFRAVFLTTITTVFGLVPLIGETSPQAKVLIPMAVSLAAGVGFATLITLVLVPCQYAILEDLRGFYRRQHIFRRRLWRNL